MITNDDTVDGRNPANQLIWRIYHYSQDFLNLRGCRISSIISMQYDDDDDNNWDDHDEI